MRRTFSLACTACRKHLWIAQGWPHPDAADPWRTCALYSAEPRTMEALRVFLFTHMDHPLVFAENTEGAVADYQEIETDPAPDPDGSAAVRANQGQREPLP